MKSEHFLREGETRRSDGVHTAPPPPTCSSVKIDLNRSVPDLGYLLKGQIRAVLNPGPGRPNPGSGSS